MCMHVIALYSLTPDLNFLLVTNAAFKWEIGNFWPFSQEKVIWMLLKLASQFPSQSLEFRAEQRASSLYWKSGFLDFGPQELLLMLQNIA